MNVVALNGNGWRVAIFLGGMLLGSLAYGGVSYIQVSAAEARCTTRTDTLKDDMQGELKEHGILLREMNERLARIEGGLAKDSR